MKNSAIKAIVIGIGMTLASTGPTIAGAAGSDAIWMSLSAEKVISAKPCIKRDKNGKCIKYGKSNAGAGGVRG